MFVALDLLLVVQLPAGRDDLVLRLDVHGVGANRLGSALAGAAAKTATDPADLQTGGKTFEVTFLLVGEVDCERIDFHGR